MPQSHGKTKKGAAQNSNVLSVAQKESFVENCFGKKEGNVVSYDVCSVEVADFKERKCVVDFSTVSIPGLRMKHPRAVFNMRDVEMKALLAEEQERGLKANYILVTFGKGEDKKVYLERERTIIPFVHSSFVIEPSLLDPNWSDIRERITAHASGNKKRAFPIYSVQDQEGHVRKRLFHSGLDQYSANHVISYLKGGQWKELLECIDNNPKARIARNLMSSFVCKYLASFGRIKMPGLQKRLNSFGVFPATWKELTLTRCFVDFSLDACKWMVWFCHASWEKNDEHAGMMYLLMYMLGVTHHDILQNPCHVLRRVNGNLCDGLMEMMLLTTHVKRTAVPHLAMIGNMEVQPLEGGAAVVSDEALNTTIEKSNDETEAEFVESEADSNIVEAEFEDFVADDAKLTTRWVNIGNVSSSSTQPIGSIIARLVLPQLLLQARNNVPNALKFKQYEFCNPGIEVTIISSCTKFQQANTGFAFVYGYDERDGVENTLNLATLSTMPHISLNGSFNTSGSLLIPFMHPSPVISIATNNGWMRQLNLGRLVAYCISPVRVGAGTSSVINYTINARFTKVKFFGQRGYYQPVVTIPCVPNMLALKVAASKVLVNSVAKPLISQMAGKTHDLVCSVEDNLLQYLEDINRDQPSTSSRRTIVQTSTVDMAQGSGITYMNKLRLNPIGTTCHPKSDVGIDKKFSMDALKQAFALVAMFDWNSISPARTRLFESTVQLGGIGHNTFGNILASNSACPADHLADMFQAQRGSIRFKFVIVGSGLHSGRIRATFEPGVSRTSSCDIDSVPFAIFDFGSDLSSVTTFEVIVPYQHFYHQNIVSNAGAPLGGNSQFRAGVFSIFVEVPLIAPISVFPSVHVLVYKAAHENFEFGIPRNMLSKFAAPSPLVPPVVPPGDGFPPPPPVAPNVPSSFLVRAARPNNNASWIQAQFQSGIGAPIFNMPSTGNTLRITSVPSLTWMDDDNNLFTNLTPRIDVFSGRSATVFDHEIFCGNERIASWTRSIGTNWNIALSGYSTFGASNWTTVQTVLATGDGDDPRWMSAPVVEKLCPTGSKIMPLSNGEKHDDLIENLRRFEAWHNFSVPVQSQHSLVSWDAAIPITFGSPVFRNQATGWMRSNKITAIFDMFRFARGSLRWVIEVSSDTAGALGDTTMTIAHIPNAAPNFDIDTQVGAFTSEGSGYALQVFSMRQNNINPAEFPHYTLGTMAYNTSYLDNQRLTQQNVGLGVCYFQFKGPPQILNVVIYRALGDDCRPYLFNGCPQREYISSVNVPYYAAGSRPLVVQAGEFKEDLTSEGIEPNPGPILSKMRGDGFIKKMFLSKKERKAVDEIIESAPEMITGAREVIEEVKTAVQAVSFNNPVVKMGDIGIQIAHVAASPKWETFILSITSIMLKIYPQGIVSGVKALCGASISIAKRLWKKLTASHQGDSAGSFLNAMWDFIGSVTGVRIPKPFAIGAGIAAIVRFGTWREKIFGFLTSLLQMFKKFVNCMLQKINPEWRLFKMLTDEQLVDVIKRYKKAVVVFTDPANFESICLSAKLAQSMFLLRKFGSNLENELPQETPMERSVKADFSNKVKLVSKLCEKMMEVANSEVVRYEPFVIASYGEPGVGKSFSVDAALDRMIVQLEEKTLNPYFTRSPATQFDDGYTSQTLCLKFDDFGATNEAEAMEYKQIMMIKSCAPYTGNFADTVDKQRQVHPKIVSVCTNDITMEHVSLKTPSALKGRRNLVCHFQLAKDWQRCSGCPTLAAAYAGMRCDNCREKNRELIDEGKHLTVTVEHPITYAPLTKALYTAEWIEYCAAAHCRYHQEELGRMANRMTAFTNIIAKCADFDDKSLRPIRPDFEALKDEVAYIEKMNLRLMTEDGKLSEQLRDDWSSLLRSPFESFKPKLFSSTSGTLRLEKYFDSFDFPNLWVETKKIFDTLQVKITDLKEKAKGIFSYGEYELGFSPPDEVSSATHKGDGITDVAVAAAAAVIPYAIGAVTFRAISRFRKTKNACLCSIKDWDGKYYMDKGLVVVDNKYYDIECKSCYNAERMIKTIDRIEAGRSADQSTPVPCICLMANLNRNVSARRTGNYIVFEDRLFHYSCSLCEGSEEVNKLKVRMGISVCTDKYDMKEPFFSKDFLLWHGIGLTTTLVLTVLNAVALFGSQSNIIGNGESWEAPVMKEQVARHNKAPKLMVGNSGFDFVNLVQKHQLSIESELGRVTVLMIGGRLGLCTHHEWSALKDVGDIKVRYNCGTEVKIDSHSIKSVQIKDAEYKGADQVLLTFPPKIQTYSSMMPHMMSESSFEDRPRKAALFDRKEGGFGMITGLPIKFDKVDADYGEGIVYRVTGYEYDIKKCGVPWEKYEGSCGSVLMDLENKKILGIHCSSQTTEAKYSWSRSGYSQAVFKEMFMELVKEENQPLIGSCGETSVNDYFVMRSEQEINRDDKVVGTLLEPLVSVMTIGKLPQPLYHMASSNIGPSPMVGVLCGPKKMPAVFRTEGEEKPGLEAMRNGIEKNKAVVNFPQSLIMAATDNLRQYILTAIEPTTNVASCRGIEEVIIGNENVPYFTSMNLQSSPGYPEKIKVTSKKHLITVKDQALESIDSELLKKHTTNMRLRSCGVVPDTIFACSLKDERLAEGKQPRLIQGAPVEHVIASRRLFIDFAASFYNTQRGTFSAVGMNALGDDWDDMIRKMKWPNNMLAGDIKALGPTLDPNVVSAVYSVINRWYEKYSDDPGVSLDNRCRQVMKEEVLNSKNVAYDTLFQTMCCSPSGQPLTVIVNTMCMYMYVLMAWYECAPTRMRNFNVFNSNVVVKIVGDDFIASVSDECIAFFNNHTLQKALGKYGVQYTSTDKTMDIDLKQSMSEISFLGRRTVKLEDRWVGQLSIEVIEDVPNWIHKKNFASADDVMYQLSVALLQEVVFHGRNKFDEVQSKLAKYWQSKNKPLTGCSWLEMHARWRENNEKDVLLSYLYRCPLA